MYRESSRTRAAAPLAAGLLLFAAAPGAPAQERRSPHRRRAGTPSTRRSLPPPNAISAKADVRFTPLDDDITSAAFELNNALNVSRVVDDKGEQIPASRNQAGFHRAADLRPPLPKGQPATLTFIYDGKLTGQEDSPVYGIKFAAIHPDFAYLMYPARWFPVNGYTHRPLRRRHAHHRARRVYRARQRHRFAARAPADKNTLRVQVRRAARSPAASRW